MTAHATRSAPSVTVRCDGCGVAYELAARNAYRHRKLDIPNLCRGCRFTTTSEPSRREIAAAKRWWLAHYSLDELRSWPAL